MSYAWHQLRCAVKALNRNCSRREKLASAYSKLIKLRIRDLPGEVAGDFDKLVGRIPRFPAKSICRQIKTEVASLTDAEVAEAISLISAMHDAVEHYQPRRNRPLETLEMPLPIVRLTPQSGIVATMTCAGRV